MNASQNAVIEARPEPQSEVAALIQAIERAAVNPAVDVDKMERLFALQERMFAKNAEVAFNEALAAVQAELPKIKRNRKNIQTGSLYADLEAVTDAAAPVYTRHGFALSCTQEDCPTEGRMRVVCFCSHRGGHTRRYQYDASLDMTGLKGNQNKTPIQGEGSTFSYARRYLTALIFNLTLTDEDNDGQSAGGCITDKQAADLQAKAEEVGADRVSFLRFLKVEKLADLPASKYAAAIRALEDKARGAK